MSRFIKCAFCGTEFMTTTTTRKYCTERCRQDAANRQDRLQRRAEALAKRERSYPVGTYLPVLNDELSSMIYNIRLLANDEDYLMKLAKELGVSAIDVIRSMVHEYAAYQAEPDEIYQADVVAEDNSAIDMVLPVLDYRSRKPIANEPYLYYHPDGDMWEYRVWRGDGSDEIVAEDDGSYHWMPVPDMRRYTDYEV